MPLKKLKKLAKKTVGKAVKKLVPKELAGIMQVAAPFTGPAAPFVYAAGAYKQSGRINPIIAASLALPYVGQIKGQGIGGLRYGDLSQYGTLGQDVLTARDVLGLRGAAEGTLRGRAEDFLFGTAGGEGPSFGEFAGEEGIVPTASEQLANISKPTQGFLGTGGKFDLVGSKLLSKKGGGLSYAKVGAYATAGLSLTETKEQIEDEGEDLGLSSGEIARLQAEAEEMWKDFDTTAFRPNVAKVAEGGLMRTNLAMGSRPTPKESGLGGLPIEADMRYTGGFMPYGAKEKADDVPARLSKNEFVFTADAVRAAGGGDINMGARRMYNTMKQLESMGRA